VLWLIVVAVAFLAPTLVHGTVFAPFDLLNAFGLGHHSTALVHNNVDSDLIQQDVPWLRLEWTQFHHGHLPLWNPYSGEGMPLGLDFITATFSLPTLLTLAFPVQYGLWSRCWPRSSSPVPGPTSSPGSSASVACPPS
jgi:hypothetical protein